MDLFDIAIRDHVAFVPGNPFYTDGGGSNSMWLNYSHADDDMIVESVRRPGDAIRKMLEE